MVELISCPKCGHSFSVEDVLIVKLEKQFKEEYQQKVNEDSNRLEKEKTDLNIEREKIEKLKLFHKKHIQSELGKLIAKEKENNPPEKLAVDFQSQVAAD